jgi:Fe-S-cluster-containing hydrogenase component 2
MGHMAGKDHYRDLGRKIDNLSMRAPWNNAFHAILKELYTSEEAEVGANMPYGLCTLAQIASATGYGETDLQRILDNMCAKGLVLDMAIRNSVYYTLSPIIIGIFEFTMMRTKGELNTKEWAHLFHDYMSGDDSFFRANFGPEKKVSPLRVLPWEETIADSDYVEILDYEKASALIDANDQFAIGICSCRHEKLHLGEKKCATPLETCTTFGPAAESMIHRSFARKASKSEMIDLFARSKETGLVLSADNVKKDIAFVCHCCSCCCNIMLGIRQFGYPNAIVTSSYIADRDTEACAECGLCADACPVGAIHDSGNGPPTIDTDLCLGCGVCALNCSSGALRLVKRQQRVLHPEDTMERIILQCLERGTLQNQMFTDPHKVSHKFLRGFVGGFLKLPPVKRALMSDTLRSSFLDTLRK